MQKTGFRDLYSEVHVTCYVSYVSPCSVDSSVKKVISSHATNTQLDISKKVFIKPSFNHAKIIFPSVAFLFSLSIYYSNKILAVDSIVVDEQGATCLDK